MLQTWGALRIWYNHHLVFALCRSERARWITVLGQDRDRQSTDRTSKFSYQQQWALWCGTGNALPLSGAFSTWMLYRPLLFLGSVTAVHVELPSLPCPHALLQILFCSVVSVCSSVFGELFQSVNRRAQPRPMCSVSLLCGGEAAFCCLWVLVFWSWENILSQGRTQLHRRFVTGIVYLSFFSSTALTQVEIIRTYTAKQSDELSLQVADVVLVYQKVNDGE